MIRLLPLLLLVGCVGAPIPYDPTQMSEKQIAAVMKEREVFAACSEVHGPWGTARIVAVKDDKRDEADVGGKRRTSIGAQCVVETVREGFRPQESTSAQK